MKKLLLIVTDRVSIKIENRNIKVDDEEDQKKHFVHLFGNVIDLLENSVYLEHRDDDLCADRNRHELFELSNFRRRKISKECLRHFLRGEQFNERFDFGSSDRREHFQSLNFGQRRRNESNLLQNAALPSTLFNDEQSNVHGLRLCRLFCTFFRTRRFSFIRWTNSIFLSFNWRHFSFLVRRLSSHSFQYELHRWKMFFKPNLFDHFYDLHFYRRRNLFATSHVDFHSISRQKFVFSASTNCPAKSKSTEDSISRSPINPDAFVQRHRLFSSDHILSDFPRLFSDHWRSRKQKWRPKIDRTARRFFCQ